MLPDTARRHPMYRKAFANLHHWGHERVGGFHSNQWWFRLPESVSFDDAIVTIGEMYIVLETKTTMSGVKCIRCSNSDLTCR